MKIITALILLLFTSALSAQTRHVDVEVAGIYYNEIWKTAKPYPITVYTDLEANVYVRLDGPNVAAGFVTADDLDGLIAALEKALTWSTKAKEAGLDATKELASFMSPYDDREQGLSLTFRSADAGETIFVMLTVVDFNNQFKKVTFSLEPANIEQLIAALEALPDAFHALKKGTSKADEILQ
jgi:hypothetical protein